MNNLTEHHFTIDRSKRSDQNKHRSFIIWFTGLSGSGKSTLANLLEAKLHSHGIHTFLLDGDVVRSGLNRDLGFTADDRTENIRRVAEVNRILLDAGLIVINAFISPCRSDRSSVRRTLGEGEFSEIFVKAELTVCEKRDVKGMYAKARKGEIAEFTGISAPYEEPVDPELVVATDHQTVEQSLEILWEFVMTRVR